MSDPICPYCGDGMQAIGTLNHIECVRALQHRIAKLESDGFDDRAEEGSGS